MTLDKRFFLQTRGMRTHQLRLEGGDASSDSVLLRVISGYGATGYETTG